MAFVMAPLWLPRDAMLFLSALVPMLLLRLSATELVETGCLALLHVSMARPGCSTAADTRASMPLAV